MPLTGISADSLSETEHQSSNPSGDRGKKKTVETKDNNKQGLIRLPEESVLNVEGPLKVKISLSHRSIYKLS